MKSFSQSFELKTEVLFFNLLKKNSFDLSILYFCSLVKVVYGFLLPLNSNNGFKCFNLSEKGSLLIELKFLRSKLFKLLLTINILYYN